MIGWQYPSTMLCLLDVMIAVSVDVQLLLLADEFVNTADRCKMSVLLG